MARVSEKSLRTTDQKLLKDIFDEQKKQTALLERIADVLDVMALEQEALHGTVDEVEESVKSMLETDEEAEYEHHNIPGFPTDPLEGFPSIRKEDK